MEKNITPINRLSWKDRLKSYKKHPGSFILLLLVGTSTVITVTVLVYLVGYILIHGVPYLRPSLFSRINNRQCDHRKDHKAYFRGKSI